MALMPEGQLPRVDAESHFVIAQDGRPTQEQLDVERFLRATLTDAAVYANRQIADSREKSLGLTRIEEGLMWLGKAIFKGEKQ